MTKLERTLRGYTTLEITGAAPELCLNRLSECGIPFWNVTPVDAFSFRISVFYRDRTAIQEVILHAQSEAKTVLEVPGIWYVLLWLQRPFLILSLAMAVFAVFVLPDYVWTISVSGNETVPTAEIIRALDDLGVRFGTENNTIESQDIKNRLLNLVDGLQWAAVNCSGGHCEVLVKEREEEPDLIDRNLVADVVASQDGTIVEMRVLEGQALCQEGDTVEMGQRLVSGLTDWVIDIQKSRAQAEIYALTWRDLEAATPSSCSYAAEITQTDVSRYLQLGRFRIKISGSSRICGAGCAKIVTRENLTLPGGYSFPVTLITETCAVSKHDERAVTKQEAASILRRYGTDSVDAAMVAGQILSSEDQLQTANGRFTMDAVYACREMIAREQEVNLFGSEQIYGRTNSERGAD